MVLKWIISMLRANCGTLYDSSCKYITLWQIYAWNCRRELTAGCGELKCSEANIIEGLIIKNHTLICIFHKLVDWQSGIVRLHDSIRHLRGWKHRESHHHSVWVLFSYFWNQQRPHSRSSSTSQRMAHLKPWKEEQPSATLPKPEKSTVSIILYDFRDKAWFVMFFSTQVPPSWSGHYLSPRNKKHDSQL